MISKKNALLFPVIIIFLFLVFTFIPSFSREEQTNPVAPPETKKFPLLSESEVKNVILFIGDGLGPAQVVAARIKNKGVSGRLYMERMPVTGLHNTFNAEGTVTDSSAAATAMATGFKTNNGMISFTPDGKKVLTIMEACRNHGKATGIVVTCDLTQSTPAAFATHMENRWDAPRVAEALIESGMNVILGGGRSQFIPKSSPNSRRQDDLDLIQRAQSKGFTYIETKEQFNSVSGNSILGLFQQDAIKLDGSDPSIAEMTKKTIQLLNQNPKGFFLMVEGSQLDSFSHRHNTEMALFEIGLLDDAVKEALEFALADKKTLVIVTGDHEAGGMVVDGDSFEGKTMEIKWVSRFHTAVPTPIFAFGPSALLFTGLLDNTDIPKIMAKLLGINDFPAILENKK